MQYLAGLCIGQHGPHFPDFCHRIFPSGIDKLTVQCLRAQVYTDTIGRPRALSQGNEASG